MTLHQMIMVVVESVIIGGIGGMVVGVLIGITGVLPNEVEHVDRRSEV